MSAGFAKFHPNLVVGGTYSGQIVLWDNRSNKRTPVQRTPLSAAAHTVKHQNSFSVFQPVFCQWFFLDDVDVAVLCCVQHPVYCVNVVGTQNANNLISISTDGKMCSWSLDMLSQPQVWWLCMDDVQTLLLHVRESEVVWFSFPPAGQSGAGVQTEQGSGCYLHGLPSGRREQLCGG